MARVKNCSAPSTWRAASNSCVRMMPSCAPCSLPIRFWPPSPRVSERQAAREVSEHRGALVVWVRRDVQNGAKFVELVQRLLDLGRAGKAALRRQGSQPRQKRCTQKESNAEVTHVCLHILAKWEGGAWGGYLLTWKYHVVNQRRQIGR